MKTLITTAFLCFTTSFLYSQINQTSDWSVFFEDDKVKLYSKYANCEMPSEGLYAEYMYIRAINKTAQEVDLSFYTDTYYDGGCTNCDHTLRDRQRTFRLQPNEDLKGECGVGLNNGLRVFSRWLRMQNPRSLTMVKVTDVTTNYIH